MKLQTIRRISQAAFLAVTLTGVIVGTTGIIYPYFFCYSNPWDVGACPLGIMEHGFVDIQNMFWTGLALLLYLFGFLSLMGLLMGRAFCGWACPIGALQDISKKFGISEKVRKKLRPNINPRWKNVKYLMLLAVPVTAYISRDLFYTNLCPVGGITGTIPTLLFYSNEWAFGSTFPVKLTSIILFSLLIILVTRGWCKYLCPIGAWLAPWNKVSAVGLKRDESSCKHCNLCEKKCPMDIKDMGVKPEPECILCGRCVDSCRFGSLKLGIQPFSSRKGMAVWTVLMLLSMSMLAGGMWLEGYDRANDINSLPCLGCLALDPSIAAEWRVTSEAQPDFILEPLASKPVFLHYRTDVCPGCDEMEPHIAILEAQYGDRVEFIHINLDHATVEEDATYDVYDFVGTPTARFGVPMFSTVIVELEASEPVLGYMTQYGSSSDQGASKRLELEDIILEALNRHITDAELIASAEPFEPGALYMTPDVSTRPALPNGNVSFSFTLRNFQASGMETALSVEKPVNWHVNISVSSIYIQGGGSAIFTVDLTGNGTVVGEIYNFTVRATGITDPALQTSSMVQVVVTNDMMPPNITTPQSDPALPSAGGAITVTVEVNDLSGVDSVKISYFSCTDVVCSASYIIEMKLTIGDTYTTDVYPVSVEHTDFHYKIIAEDVHGNTVTTQLYDIELEPVEHHAADATAKPKWIGVVLLLVSACVAIYIALSGRIRPPEGAKFEILKKY